MKIFLYKKNLWPKTVLLLLSALFIAILPAFDARADIYDDQINNLQNQAVQYQNQANELRGKVSSLQGELAALNAESAALQTQIEANEAQLAQLNQKIQDTERRIASQKQALAQNLKSMYLESTVTPLEMVASSKSIGDFIDKQEYRNKIREGIQKSLAEIKALKIQLDTQKKAVEEKLTEQKGMRDQLAVQEQQKNQLIEQTRGEEASYQQLVQQKNAEIASVRAQQAAAFARLFGTGYRSSGVYGRLEWKNLSANVACGGGYPSYLCAYAQDTVVDKWDLYNRECVSYAAWAIENRFGKTVPEFNGNGNADDWPGYLNGRGGIVANETPAVGAAVVIPSAMIGGVGHVAVVESIDGSWMHVTQYNWNSPPDGRFSQMDLKIVSGLVFIHF